MDITITSQNKKEYLLIESKGTLYTKDDLIRHSEMVLEEIQKYNAQKILVDDIQTHFPLELFPYFDQVKEYKENFPPEIRELKVAIVVDEKYKEIAYTWETLCVSRGYKFFAFTDFKNAETWLLK